MLTQACHAHALRQILSYESVGVLVTTPLPRMIRPREVEDGPRQPLAPPVVVELRAVVRSHGLDAPRPADESGQPPPQRVGRPILELADEHEARPALDECDDAVLRARARHGVSLPVADALARLDLGRALRDHPLPGEPAAAVVSPVALTPLLPGSAQVGVELPAAPLVAPDVAVDGLVAGGESPRQAQVPGDMLGAPLSPEQPVHDREVVGGEALVAA